MRKLVKNSTKREIDAIFLRVAMRDGVSASFVKEKITEAILEDWNHPESFIRKNFPNKNLPTVYEFILWGHWSLKKDMRAGIVPGVAL